MYHRHQQKQHKFLLFLLITTIIGGYFYFKYDDYITWQNLKKYIQFDKMPEMTCKTMPLINEKYFYKLLNEIKKAESYIYVAMFVIHVGDYPHHPVNILVDYLVEAQQRGIEIKIIMNHNKPQKKALERMFIGKSKTNAFKYIKSRGLNIMYPKDKLRVHDKIVIIDGYKIFIGAHNWTYAALLLNNETSVFIELYEPNDIFLKFFRAIENGKRL